MKPIQMVDLFGQHQKIEFELKEVFDKAIKTSTFIGGKSVVDFAESLAQYLGVKNVITCANGTDAIQLALMALELPKDSEIIVPDFCFVSPAEVVALLGFKPVFASVCNHTFNLTAESIEQKISSKTKAVIVAHLFGQSAEIDSIKQVTQKYNIYLIEDVAQSLGAQSKIGDKFCMTGSKADIATTSFFPTKNLGGIGDGGAVYTNNDNWAEKIKMYANHGSKIKYSYQLIGSNSRLDALQAGILQIKLKYLPNYLKQRASIAQHYFDLLSAYQSEIKLPYSHPEGVHTFNQFTIQVENRVQLENYLKKVGIPYMIYYPSLLSNQEAFQKYINNDYQNNDNELLCKSVLSLPMHTELEPEQQIYICDNLLLGLGLI